MPFTATMKTMNGIQGTKQSKQTRQSAVETVLEANIGFAAKLYGLIEIAENLQMRVLMRSADELYGLELAKHPRIHAFTLLDDSDTIAILDTRRKDRKPVLLLNADLLMERLYPNQLIIAVMMAVMDADHILYPRESKSA